jgi:hypothetical protein
MILTIVPKISKLFLGKVLRIDPDYSDATHNYSVPEDNPFVGRGDAWAEIWAYGLRNPWRCFFDRLRPDMLLCGDVGQDTVEEINMIVKGGNYGWKYWEGNFRTPLYANEIAPRNDTLIWPVLQYTHKEMNGSCATIGGLWYRGTRNDCMYGRVIVSDYQGVVWAANETNWLRQRIRWNCAADSPSCQAFSNGSTIGNLFTIGEDANADLYWSTANGIYRLVENSRCGLQNSCKFLQHTSTSTTGVTGPSTVTTNSNPATTSADVTTTATTGGVTSGGTTKASKVTLTIGQSTTSAASPLILQLNFVAVLLLLILNYLL